jgi:hypothetical protein
VEGAGIIRSRGFPAWRQFTVVLAVGAAFYIYSLSAFRKSIAVSK